MNPSRSFVLAIMLCAPAFHDAQTATTDFDPGMAEHTGGYVLELDAPSVKDRGRCLEVTLSNFGKMPDRQLWLVVRSLDRAGGRPLYESVALAEAPASVGPLAICLSRPPESTHAQGLTALVIQVAVYRSSARDLKSGFWEGPQNDSMRLSNWLNIPDTVLRSRLTLPDRLSKARTR